MYIIHFYESGFTTLIRFNYWILCETVLPGQGDVPRLAEVDFTDTDTVAPCRHANYYNTDVVFGKLKQTTRLLDVKKKDLDWD